MSAPALTRRGALGASAAAAASVSLAACGATFGPEGAKRTVPNRGRNVMAPDPGVRRFGAGDVGIVNYALLLEHLETDFYEMLVGSGLLRGRERAIAAQIGRSEQEHVDALTALVRQLGAEPTPKPRTSFALTSREQALDLAAEIENIGAAAYLGQAPRIADHKVLETALAIHTVEGAHAAALCELAGRTITPDGSIAAPDTAATVLASVKPYLPA